MNMDEAISGNWSLTETIDNIFIHPDDRDFKPNEKFISINRITDEIGLTSNRAEYSESARIRTIPIGGIIGVIRLLAGPYLVVIRSREPAGYISSHVIWKMSRFELVPFRRSLLHLSQQEANHNKTYLEMLDAVLNTPSFYYSHTYDLTHYVQSLELNSPHFFKQTIVQRAEPRFMWNTNLLQPFQHNAELHKFCVVLMHGFVSVNSMNLAGHQFKFTLITRRSSKRPGTRLFSRGIDIDGNVSNFVETEQIVEFGNDIASYVQVRGSIPLFWTQRPNLKYKPRPVLAQANHMEAFTKHFQDMILKYNRTVCLDLVNQTGSEAVLETAFKQHSLQSGIPELRYEGFDFHHECRKMQWHRLEILTNRVSQEIEEFGYFLRSKGTHQQQQEGVFRTNCIDCLDRTNVVQGMLAKINLDQVLKRLGILSEGDSIIHHPHIDYSFRNVWADNGDACSTQYAGTGALKTDYTRTGKRTWAGPPRDGYLSIVRYFKNNFMDGFRQDAMDLFLGNYRVTDEEGKTKPSPLEKDRDLKYYTLPAFMLLSFVMFTMLVVVPSEYTSEYMLYILFWGCMTFATGGVIMSMGNDFVDKPVLTEAYRLTM